MNSEALRLLDEMEDGFAIATRMRDPDKARGRKVFCDACDQLRALLSAQEPTAEHWRQAIREEIGEVVISEDELQCIEQRARGLASDDTPSKSRAKRIEKQREAK